MDILELAPWLRHCSGGTVVHPPRKTIFFTSRAANEARIVYVVRENTDYCATIDDPERWRQGVSWKRASNLYPFTERGWLACQDLARRYRELKEYAEKEMPKILKRAIKEEHHAK